MNSHRSLLGSPGDQAGRGQSAGVDQRVHRAVLVQLDGHHRIEGQPGGVDSQLPACLLVADGVADQGEDEGLGDALEGELVGGAAGGEGPTPHPDDADHRRARGRPGPAPGYSPPRRRPAPGHRARGPRRGGLCTTSADGSSPVETAEVVVPSWNGSGMCMQVRSCRVPLACRHYRAVRTPTRPTGEGDEPIPSCNMFHRSGRSWCTCREEGCRVLAEIDAMKAMP